MSFFAFALLCAGTAGWGAVGYEAATYHDPGPLGLIAGAVLVASWMFGGVRSPRQVWFTAGASAFVAVYVVAAADGVPWYCAPPAFAFLFVLAIQEPRRRR